MSAEMITTPVHTRSVEDRRSLREVQQNGGMRERKQVNEKAAEVDHYLLRPRRQPPPANTEGQTSLRPSTASAFCNEGPANETGSTKPNAEQQTEEATCPWLQAAGTNPLHQVLPAAERQSKNDLIESQARHCGQPHARPTDYRMDLRGKPHPVATEDWPEVAAATVEHG